MLSLYAVIHSDVVNLISGTITTGIARDKAATNSRWVIASRRAEVDT